MLFFLIWRDVFNKWPPEEHGARFVPLPIKTAISYLRPYYYPAAVQTQPSLSL